ncbi:hypothetical protein HBZ99_004106 [Salmonella enterica subsp. enterica]|nr:hypothetical protein [Salmonella enterica]EEP4265990.1 hypothetical protein [Salmonella enterica subsp. enterica serovar Oranienburg]HBM0024028.1 hypothetical protein [Salmonella enterica subsp. enterica serovar Muenchen]EDY5957154.1 hypothetical protein [Salmonella enterica]EEP8813705.1 hypothetical protein [Salmonella enterica subsp. enterica serovar Oranienburg]
MDSIVHTGSLNLLLSVDDDEVFSYLSERYLGRGGAYISLLRHKLFLKQIVINITDAQGDFHERV